MANIQMNVASATLGKKCNVSIIIPSQIISNCRENTSPNRRYPVLYLLHGLSDNNSTWGQRSCIELFAEKYQMFIIMPDGDRSFYTDTFSGLKYWSFISEELPNIIEGMFPISKERKDRFAAGLSMGGYGALKLALNFPERYAAAIALSSVTQQSEIFNILDQAQGDALYGPERIVPESCNLEKLVEKCAKLPKELRPKLLHYCGTEDFLYEGNIKFRNLVQATGAFDYLYEESPGTHNWFFWNDKIEKALDLLPIQ